MIEISSGVYLATAGELAEEQEAWGEFDAAKEVKFSTSPFWITTNDGQIEPLDLSDMIELIESGDLGNAMELFS